jgi:hypothetical protein
MPTPDGDGPRVLLSGGRVGACAETDRQREHERGYLEANEKGVNFRRWLAT